jgi:hypothetical protein
LRTDEYFGAEMDSKGVLRQTKIKIRLKTEGCGTPSTYAPPAQYPVSVELEKREWRKKKKKDPPLHESDPQGWGTLRIILICECA